ncbi:hypothetical protein evm_012490 [Chilo suppressalis]|nr:hypothetical protein evm_012490 [Chilo suppressalis]
MNDDSGGMSVKKKKPHKRRKEEIHSDVSDHTSDEEIENKYIPYRKQDHIRTYPPNSQGTVFSVYLESMKPEEKFGNKSPIYLNNIFSRFVKGVKQLKRVNATKYAVIFDNSKNGNALLNNTNFLKNHELKAYIPASQAECIGVVKFVPTEISNKTLFNKLISSQEILGIRRFTKKTPEGIVPLKTVSITFAGNILPDYVTFDLCALRVEPYVRPGVAFCKHTFHFRTRFRFGFYDWHSVVKEDLLKSHFIALCLILMSRSINEIASILSHPDIVKIYNISAKCISTPSVEGTFF